MKKFFFAVQVFGIIAMFPIYVVLEMNQGIARSPENKNHSVLTEKAEKPPIPASLNSKVQNENSLSGKKLQ